jgi:hypothetical protein
VTGGPSAPEPLSPSPEARRGRAAFFAIAGLYLVWELGVLGLQLVHGSPLVAQSAVRTAGGAALFFFAWRGLAWARALLAVAFGIFAAAGWLTAWSGAYGALGWGIAAVGTGFGAAGVALVFEPRLGAYFRFQREHD